MSLFLGNRAVYLSWTLPPLWDAVPFGLHPDIFAGAVLLGLLGLMVVRTMGWTRWLPGLEALLGCDEPEGDGRDG